MRGVPEIEAEIRALEDRLQTLRAELAEAGGGGETAGGGTAAAAPEPAAPSEPGKIRIVIADDEQDIRELVGTLVVTQQDLELVGVAEDTQGAVATVLEHEPDVVVLDLSMPGGGGIQAAQEIMRVLPETRIVGFTAHDTMDAQFEFMKAGIVSFLLKGVPNQEILSAIRKAAESGPGRTTA